MSDWIRQKAEEFRQQKADRDFRESTVDISNYWVALMHQLEQDIQTMNAVPEWKEQCSPPIEIKREHEYYVIKKLHYPLVIVALLNKGSELVIDTVTQASMVSQKRSHEEHWNVVPDGRFTCLERFRDKLIVPEQASEAILKPIVDSILASIEQKARGASW